MAADVFFRDSLSFHHILQQPAAWLFLALVYWGVEYVRSVVPSGLAEAPTCIIRKVRRRYMVFAGNG